MEKKDSTNWTLEIIEDKAKSDETIRPCTKKVQHDHSMFCTVLCNISLFATLTCRTGILSCRCAHRWAPFCWFFLSATGFVNLRVLQSVSKLWPKSFSLKAKAVKRWVCDDSLIHTWDQIDSFNLAAVTPTNAASWVSISSRTAVQCVLPF